jgi:hypothetical protein
VCCEELATHDATNAVFFLVEEKQSFKIFVCQVDNTLSIISHPLRACASLKAPPPTGVAGVCISLLSYTGPSVIKTATKIHKHARETKHTNPSSLSRALSPLASKKTSPPKNQKPKTTQTHFLAAYLGTHSVLNQLMVRRHASSGFTMGSYFRSAFAASPLKYRLMGSHDGVATEALSMKRGWVACEPLFSFSLFSRLSKASKEGTSMI